MPTRSLAAIAVAGQLAFVAAWLVAGALEPGYSAIDQAVSDLAALDAENRWILSLGLGSLALSDASTAVLLRRTLGLRGRLPAAMFGAAAVGVVAIMLLPLDCSPSADTGCEARIDAGEVSARHDGHGVAAVLTHITLIATPFAVAAALGPGRFGRYVFAAGLVGVATVIVVAALDTGEPG